jgi:F-type H+-transporting ATPase subunit beta
LLSPDIVGARHYATARQVRETIAHYRSLEDIISMLGLEELSSGDQRIVQRARRLIRFLTQPFFVTEAFTGKPGRVVSIEETLDGCEAILGGEFDSAPESALYMIGGIEEARGKTRPGSAAAPDRRPAEEGAAGAGEPAQGEAVADGGRAGSGARPEPRAAAGPAQPADDADGKGERDG